MTSPLFQVAAAQVAMTTDEWYTPRWLFKAADLVFDLDVCAPVDPVYRTCPARRYLTIVEDGLTHPWKGVVWCNPPYSKARVWVDRLAAHDSWLALLRPVPEVAWMGQLLKVADAVTFPSVDFGRPDGTRARLFWPTILAGRGNDCVQAVARVAAADRFMLGAYQARPQSVELTK